MPPKTSAASSSRDVAAAQLASALACLKGEKVQNENGKAVSRIEAAVKIWSHALQGEAQREEVLKAGLLPFLVGLLERGDPQLKWAACGVLHALAQSEKHTSEVVTGKVITLAAGLLSGPHDRARQPAAQLLAFAAQRLEYCSKVSDTALLPLLQCCQPGVVSAWGGARITALHCLAALRALIENVQGEHQSMKVARRQQLMRAGAVPILLDLLNYSPRLPASSTHAAFSTTSAVAGAGPAPSHKPGKAAAKPKAKGHGKGKGKNKKEERPPAGRKDLIATHAAACLRFLALCPTFQEEVLASGKLPALVDCLQGASAEQAAYVSGILWEMTADIQVAQQVLECDGVPGLLSVVASHIASAKGGKKGKKKTKGGEAAGPGKKADRAEAQAVANHHEIAVCNAVGALHHLTFLDAAKLQLCAPQGAGLLVQCLKLGHAQIYENASGALWNAGLHPDNTQQLVSASAPPYLAQPVPSSWLVKTQPDFQAAPALEMASGTGRAAPAFFITQAHGGV